jgi:uridine kinase
MILSLADIEKIKNIKPPAIIAISGFGGSGKSTLAKEISREFNAPVVGIDSFFKDRTSKDYSLWEIIDFLRIEREILVPFLNKDKEIHYGHFDWNENKVVSEITVMNKGYLIIEGVGLLRPELLKYFSYTIWVDTPIEESIFRGKKRDREVYNNPQDESWDTVWKENDIQCFEKFKPKEVADLVIKNDKRRTNE